MLLGIWKDPPSPGPGSSPGSGAGTQSRSSIPGASPLPSTARGAEPFRFRGEETLDRIGLVQEPVSVQTTLVGVEDSASEGASLDISGGEFPELVQIQELRIRTIRTCDGTSLGFLGQDPLFLLQLELHEIHTGDELHHD